MSVSRVDRPQAGRLGAVLAGMLLAGCAPKDPGAPKLPQPPPAQPAHSSWNDEATSRRISNLEREAGNFADDSSKLPGNDAAQHSRIMQRIFTDLLQTLPLLQNPGSDRVLSQRLNIIQTSRAQLAAGSAGLAIEPAIDTALRAASAALADISHGDSYEQTDIGPLLDKLSAQINRLDFERDPNLHRVDVADAVMLTSQVISKMAASLSGRMTAEQQPATAPASAPAPEGQK